MQHTLIYNKLSELLKYFKRLIKHFDFIWQKNKHVYVSLIESLSWFKMSKISMVYKKYIIHVRVYGQGIWQLYNWSLALIICFCKLMVIKASSIAWSVRLSSPMDDIASLHDTSQWVQHYAVFDKFHGK